MIVRQGSWQSHNSDELRCLLNLADGPRDDSFKDWASWIVQQVNFIDNKQLYKFHVGTFTWFTSDDIPLLRCSHDDLCVIDLLSSQVGVTSELPDFDTVAIESSLEITNDFRDKSFHRSDVDNFECFCVDGVVWSPAWVKALQDWQQSDISFTSTGWCAY